MLRQLLSLFRPGDPLNAMVAEFTKMLELTREMVTDAGRSYVGLPFEPEKRNEIYRKDIVVNRHQRSIRKRIVAHLSVTGTQVDLPYCLALMGLTKDAERIGDYAKNLFEVADFGTPELPDDKIVAELQELRSNVETMFAAVGPILSDSDSERALELIRHGKTDARRADTLLSRVARSSYDSGTTTALVLGIRYYKRIGGHLVNILTSVVMPLHKVDFYDEKETTSGDAS